MKEYGLFDIIGPQMIGPSSSHTAGAARIGGVAHRLAGGRIKKAKIILYGSFSDTGRGHGTDKALIAGLLGMAPNDDRLKKAPEIAREKGIDIEMIFSEEAGPHPNTARIIIEDQKGKNYNLLGASVGGGSIEILEVNGMEVSFGCDYPTLLIFHEDRPGVISHVTSLLAWQNINIAFMKVFRNSKRQDACMVIETDEEITEYILEHINSVIPGVVGVCML